MLALFFVWRRFVELMIYCHELSKRVHDPYRPELHYMRGPKWRAKYQA